jgi:hypothetical protein
MSKNKSSTTSRSSGSFTTAIIQARSSRFAETLLPVRSLSGVPTSFCVIKGQFVGD